MKLLPIVLFLSNPAFPQEAVNAADSQAKSGLREFRPAVKGDGDSSVLSARQVPGKNGISESHQMVILNRASNQAILADSTNQVCSFKGRLFTAIPTGPGQSVFINSSQSFGTNDFDDRGTLGFVNKIGRNYFTASNSNRTIVDLKPLLRKELETQRSALGTPIRQAELEVENGNLTLHFESFTHIRGKVIFDDQLNPISMMLISTNSP